MHVPIFDETLDSEIDVHDPAFDDGRNFSVGSPLEAKVSEAAEPQRNHALLVI